jgi:hypothetical protein
MCDQIRIQLNAGQIGCNVQRLSMVEKIRCPAPLDSRLQTVYFLSGLGWRKTEDFNQTLHNDIPVAQLRADLVKW